MGEAEDKIYDQAWEAADLGDLGLALRSIDSLLEKYPGSAAYWVTKAAFLEKGGDLEGGEDAARRAVKLDTRNEHAWTKLGYLLGRCGRFQEARDCFRNSLAIHEGYDVHTMAAAAEFELGRPRRAVFHARRALELNPDWEEARNILKVADRLSARKRASFTSKKE